MSNETNRPVPSHAVTPSAAMTPPPFAAMAQRREYPVQPCAPAVHARTWFDAAQNRAGLTFNGCDLITFELPAGLRPTLRFHSDGDFLSAPFTQQAILALPETAAIRVRFQAPVELWNMRPRRAQSGEAILGQVGSPLLYGVNGLYLPDWDLLVSWHGYDFHWTDTAVRTQNNQFVAEITLNVGTKPWVILLRPRYYGEHLGFATHKPWAFRPNPRAITGWCSWEAYHSHVTQADIESAAQALRPLKPYGLSILQIDDGYQQTQVPLRADAPVGESWMHLNEKFPDGHAGIVEPIRAAGFEAGIWTNATLTHREACEQTDYCLRDAKGDLLCGDWIQYVLDCLPETLARHVTPYYRSFREAGYSYVKSDSLRHLLYDGLQEAVRLGLMDNETARERQRAYMEAARAGLGPETYYLSCWGVLTPSIGVCDAMRVATDSNPSWGAFSMQMRETARWFGSQRILFTLDPDVVCVRGPLPWARMLLSLVSLTGGLMMISDKPEAYDEERLDLIRRTIPGLTTRAAETGPIDYTTPACASTRGRDEAQASFEIGHIEDAKTPFASLWCTHFDQGGRLWCAMQRCAVVPLEALALPVSALALDPSKAYVAFDYWQQALVPVREGMLELPALNLGDTTVLSVQALQGDMPLLLGSDRHVSMDAVSVTEYMADETQASLAFEGFAGLEAVYTLYAPALRGAVESTQGCEAAVEREGNLLRVRVTFAEVQARVILR